MKGFYLLLFIIIGCSSTLPDESLSLSEHLKIGMDYLDEEKYVKAQDEFKFVLSRGTGTDYGDDAQFFLAEAYFLNDQFLLSITEYENLTRKMAFSPFFEKSRFRICEAFRIESPDYYNDQSYTEKALERYIEFLDDFPDSEYNQTVTESMSILRNKLAMKLYETGVLYLKMDEFEPARMSFNNAVDKYYDTDIIDQVHVGIIKSFIQEKNIDQAKEYWLNKGQEHVLSEELIEEVDQLFIKAEK